ncbi:hypothetical protein PIB30_063557 [Stylosanthes scabra]|uniref:Uncharacterized protein n=1 Tax=Stylosanthes scabra TaxID=79078 RepID=A0ABU6UN51_9FABA|nr:hypothetical protein [Stylosanthes scabra]
MHRATHGLAYGVIKKSWIRKEFGGSVMTRYCLLCGFHAPPHGFAFDKSMDDSQSPQAHPLVRYCSLCGFHAPPHDFAFDKSMDDSQSPQAHLSKRVLLGRGIHTLIRSVSFPSPINVGLTGANHLQWQKKSMASIVSS